MKHLHSCGIVTAIFFAFAGVTACGQPNVVSGDHIAGEPIQPDQLTWEWAVEEWIGDDSPFVKISQEVKEVKNKGNFDKDYLRELEDRANQNPEDVEAQFRWGYAMLEAPYAGIALQSGPYNDYHSVVRALARPKSPQSYIYARLRFVLMSLEYQYTPLKELGLRLINRNPEDTPVKTYLILYLGNIGSEEERKLGLKYAQQLVTQVATPCTASNSLLNVPSDVSGDTPREHHAGYQQFPFQCSYERT